MTDMKNTAAFAKKIYAALRKVGLVADDYQSKWSPSRNSREIQIKGIAFIKSPVDAKVMLDKLGFIQSPYDLNVHTMTLNAGLNGLSENDLAAGVTSEQKDMIDQIAKRIETEGVNSKNAIVVDSMLPHVKKERKLLKKWLKLAQAEVEKAYALIAAEINADNELDNEDLADVLAEFSEIVLPIAHVINVAGLGEIDQHELLHMATRQYAQIDEAMLQVNRHVATMVVNKIQAARDDLRSKPDQSVATQLTQVWESSANWLHHKDYPLAERISEFLA